MEVREDVRESRRGEEVRRWGREGGEAEVRMHVNWGRGEGGEEEGRRVEVREEKEERLTRSLKDL